MTTCLMDGATGEEYCCSYQTGAVRSAGSRKLVNAARALLYVFVDLDTDGAVERYPLFADALGPDTEEIYYWAYDNSGLKLLQLRFYEIPANVH